MRSSDRPYGVAVPPPPRPSANSSRDGAERAKAMAQQYLPDLVILHAAIALGEHADASLHTRAYSARELRELASGVAPGVPSAPPPHAEGGELPPDKSSGFSDNGTATARGDRSAS